MEPLSSFPPCASPEPLRDTVHHCLGRRLENTLLAQGLCACESVRNEGRISCYSEHNIHNGTHHITLTSKNKKTKKHLSKKHYTITRKPTL